MRSVEPIGNIVSMTLGDAKNIGQYILDKIERDVLEVGPLSPVCRDAQEGHVIRGRPAVHAEVNLARERLRWTPASKSKAHGRRQQNHNIPQGAQQAGSAHAQEGAGYCEKH